MQKIALLNAGSKTRAAFALGVDTSSLVFYRSKNMLLHIDDTGLITFVHKNEVCDFNIDYLFTRLRAHDQHFCGILFEHLDSLGVKMNDPVNQKFVHAEEKITQMAALARANIKIPETVIFQEDSFVSNEEYLRSKLFFPCVFKTDGSQGRNVVLVQNRTELDDLISEKPTHRLCLIQRVIPNTFDTRTLVFNGKILGTIKRIAQNGAFHNNVAKGALVEPYTLTESEAAIAIAACKATGIDFGGVDFIHTENGPIVLEVNKSPQINGFESIYGKDFVFSTIAKIIEVS
ncbi:ATP-grasp domain-containing protein [Patescibacteria group bacterium]|nr:ATP-grasp domain-containing protein [Patescibacteria group bacterium]